MTSDALKTTGLIGALIAGGLALNIVAMAGKAHGAQIRHKVFYDYTNDGHMRARVASAQKARHGKRAGRDHRVARDRRPARHVSMVGVVPELAVKVRAIVAECRSTVVSAVSRRPNRSNHPIGRAVDLRGNPKCIYKVLAGWPGGYSTDYWTAPGGPHVHVSYHPGGQEWGARFAHRRNPFIRTRYARANFRGAW